MIRFANILRGEDIEVIITSLQGRLIAIADLLEREVWTKERHDKEHYRIYRIMGKLDLLVDLKGEKQI